MEISITNQRQRAEWRYIGGRGRERKRETETERERERIGGRVQSLLLGTLGSFDLTAAF